MKHKFLKRLIVASVVVSTLTTLAPVGASAAWVKNYSGAWSYTEGYRYATGWRQISGTWYFFDSLGQMRTGWIYSGSQWYYADLSGAMQTGVIQIEGKIYLFSSSGAMQKGSCIINTKLYNFDDNGACIGPEYPMPVKGFDYYGNNTTPYIPSQIISEDAKLSSDIPSDGSVQVKQYKITFKDPEAEDDDDEILKTRTVDEDTKMTLYKPSKSGYTFIEWNTDDDGDGTGYDYDDKITVKKDMTLYAQWEEEEEDSEEDDTIKVDSITVLGSNGLDKITAKGGSLQMTKKVTPGDSTNQKVTWSVSNGTGEATISSSGKLTAVSNGTVIVKATATDGSGVVGSTIITISGQ